MLKGKHHTPESNELNRLAHLGKTGYWKGKKKPWFSEWLRKNSSEGKNPFFGRNQKGENNPMFGKKRPKHSEYMKNGGAAHANSFNKSPSKAQVQLYEKVKVFYSSAILNYPHRNYSIDIAIPEFKIAIEFDGWFWHKDKKEADKKRQEEIEKDGWKFLRYSKLPSISTLSKDLCIM